MNWYLNGASAISVWTIATLALAMPVVAQDKSQSVRLATTSAAAPLFIGQVAPYFQTTTGLALEVEAIENYDSGDLTSYDFAFIPAGAVADLAEVGSALNLTPFRTYLDQCGAGRGSFIDEQGEPFGVFHIARGIFSRALPPSHSFLQNDGMALVALSDNALASREGREFDLLQGLNQAFVRFLPLVPVQWIDTVVDISNGSPTLVRSPDSVSIVGYEIDPTSGALSMDLRVINRSSRALPELKAYVFGVEPARLPNRHADVMLSTPVNEIGPVAGYFFGPLLPGDAVTRRLRFSGAGADDSLQIAWNLRLAPGLQFLDNKGTGWGSGCSTENPEPIPDPFPEGGTIAFGAGCFDTCCSNTHGDCNPHRCGSGGGTDCGCLPSN